MPDGDKGVDVNRLRCGVMIGLLCLVVAGCSNSRPSTTADYTDPQTQGGGNGYLLGDSPLSIGIGGKSSKPEDNGGGALGVNAYLWRGALDTLSFMPLASADPFGGVIITDWYSPPAAPGERFKATAYILGRQLRADGVRVSVFRQVQQGGQWADAPVSASTTGEIENKVLARARELRAQSASN